MTTNLEQLTAEAMRDREADAEALWFAEAEQRLEELHGGKVQGIDSDDAFRAAREALQR